MNAHDLLIDPAGASVVTVGGIRYAGNKYLITSHPAVTSEFSNLPDGDYTLFKRKAPAPRASGSTLRKDALERLVRHLQAASDWQAADSLQIAVVGDGESKVPDTLLFRTISRPSYPFAMVRDLHRHWHDLLHPAFRMYYSPSRKAIRLGDPDTGASAYIAAWRHDALDERAREVRDELSDLLGDHTVGGLAMFRVVTPDDTHADGQVTVASCRTYHYAHEIARSLSTQTRGEYGFTYPDGSAGLTFRDGAESGRARWLCTAGTDRSTPQAQFHGTRPGTGS